MNNNGKGNNLATTQSSSFEQKLNKSQILLSLFTLKLKEAETESPTNTFEKVRIQRTSKVSIPALPFNCLLPINKMKILTN
jgi:hypothetical protein